MIVNGAVFLFILGVWVAYKLACWCGEPAPSEQTTNHENGRQER